MRVDAGCLRRKYPNAPKEWRWQWVFPQENRWKNRKTGESSERATEQGDEADEAW
jgi:hypothetical protein